MRLKIIRQYFSNLKTRQKILLTVVVGLSFLFLVKNIFIENFLTRYNEINIKEALLEDEKDPGWLGTFSTLVDLDGKFSNNGMVLEGISPRTPGVMRFLFNKPVSFDKFSLFFYGNLHSISSSLPKDFWVYSFNEKNEWYLIDEVKNNSLPLYQFRSNTRIITNGLEIVVVNPAFYTNPYSGGVWYKNLKFFEKQRVSLWEGVKYFVNENKNTLPAYWIYYFTYFNLLFIPGFVIISLVEKRKKININSDMKIIFCPIFSIVFMFLGTILYLLSGVKLFLVTYIIIFFVTIVLFFKMKLIKNFTESKTPLVFMLVALFVVFLTIAHRDYLLNTQYISSFLDNLKPIPIEGYPGYFGDNFLPWRIARVYLHRMPIFSSETQSFVKDSTLFDRTPLLPLITTGILHVFGEGHFIYQRFIEVLGVLFYGVFFVLIKKFFSNKIAVITLLLMLINIPLSFMPFNAENFYKYFSLYPILLSVILFLHRRDINRFLIGILAGLSFLIHPITLLYSITLVLLCFFRDKFTMKFVRNIFPIFFVLISLAGLWYLSPTIFNTEKLINPSRSLFIERALTLNENLVINKIVGFSNIFIPNILRKGISSEKISWFSREYGFEFFRYSLISNLTPVFFILFCISSIKNIRKNYEFIVLAVFPLIIYWLFFLHQLNRSYHYGGSFFHLYPFIVPFFLAYVVNWLSGKGKPTNLIIIGSYIVFMAFNLYYISGNFTTMKCASWIVGGLFLSILATYLVISLFLLSYGVTKKNVKF